MADKFEEFRCDYCDSTYFTIHVGSTSLNLWCTGCGVLYSVEACSRIYENLQYPVSRWMHNNESIGPGSDQH